MGGPVKLTVFASELGPETNAQTVRLMQEVAALSDKLPSVSVLNPHIDRERAEAYDVEYRRPSSSRATATTESAFSASRPDTSSRT